MKCIDASTSGYTLPPGIYEVSDINLMLKSILPDDGKVIITFHHNKLKSNLTSNNTITFTETSFFCTILGFTKIHLGLLSDIEGFVQLTPGSYKSDKPNFVTDVDEVHLKCDGILGRVVF